MRRTLGALGLAAWIAGCAAHGPAGSGEKAAAQADRSEPGQPVSAPPADSATILLWHFNETTGTRVVDDGPGPYHLDGTFGPDTRSELGRIAGARSFTRSINSFAIADYATALDTPTAMTIEAWIRPRSFRATEDTPLAGRWNFSTNDQSWLFAIRGGNLVFQFQPEGTGGVRRFVSVHDAVLDRWTHVAASFDGHVVQFYLDGILDSQFAVVGRIQTTRAPFLVGCAFDTRALTSFSGDLRVGPDAISTNFQAFDGSIDEVRLSSVARSEFPYAR
jgi:hypothetical protein